jgi:hypothetical protein
MSFFLTYSINGLRISGEIPMSSDSVPLITYYFIGSLLYTLLSLIWFVVCNFYMMNQSMPETLTRLAESIGAAVKLSVPRRLHSVAVIKLLNGVVSLNKSFVNSDLRTSLCNDCIKWEQCKENAHLEEMERNLKDIFEKKVLIINFTVLILLSIVSMLVQIILWMIL